MKPSGQARLAPNGGTSLKPVWFVVAVPVSIAMVVFPPLGVLVGLTIAAVLLSKILGHRQEHKAARSHRGRMDAFYQAQEDARREEYYAQRTFVNPGWRV